MKHECEAARATHLGLCSRGFNYVRLQGDLLAFGFLVHDHTSSPAQKKALHKNRDHVVTSLEITQLQQASLGAFSEFINDLEAEKKSILEEYRKTQQYKADFLEVLRPEIQKSFAFVHDYKQFIAQVRQNINVVIEQTHMGEEFKDKLAAASSAERAIYWASILMEEKLQTAFLLLHPERITNQADTTIFRPHGLVHKYLRIYESAFFEKGVNIKMVGESVGEIRGNGSAVPVIPHTLIDNALKYSKRGAEVLVEFRETDTTIELLVSSYGPKIHDDEYEKVFELFYRGRSAVQDQEEGAGFGLYLAQFIAEQMGTRLNVRQLPDRRGAFGYWTTFSCRFVRER
jgi:signal transduction histidine kinase